MAAHRLLGFVVTGATVLQIGMGMFRCGLQSRYRFVFNWVHRSIGILAFASSIPTIFLIVSVFRNSRSGLMVILSVWTGWIVIIVTVFEIIQLRCRSNLLVKVNWVENVRHEHELHDNTMRQASITSGGEDLELDKFSNLKLFLFLFNLFVAISLSVALIVLLWRD